MIEIPGRSFKEALQPRERDFNFAMRHNGFIVDGRSYVFDGDAFGIKAVELSGLEVSLFGPSPDIPPFFYIQDAEFKPTASALSQVPVLETISKFRRTDEEQAGRIAFVLGGIVREMSGYDDQGDINRAVRFVAKMTNLGEHKSGDAIAASMAMYVLSGGKTEEDKDFEGNVYHMADAIAEDPIVPRETSDLGLSQVIRLRAFIDKVTKTERRPYPEIARDMEQLANFPTVGAEFHFPQDAPDKYPHFWQRLALLNTSQYQLGSYIQLCRDDRDVIEIRMNPSVYPVAIANWNHMRAILPELNQAYFTATFNRDGQDFHWENVLDKMLLRRLRGLGLLSYATIFENVPHQDEIEEVNFGGSYLGQTVKMARGKFDFSGQWGGGMGKFGQFGIYAGYGNNFPYLAYFPSMVLSEPNILSPVDEALFEVNAFDEALEMSPGKRKYIFATIMREIAKDPKLSGATEAGARIIKSLTP